MQLVRDEWLEYDFFTNSALPNELQSRGFDADFNLPGYLYREDGMKLWNAMGTFASDFVQEVYANDQEVANDKVLQRWADETVDPEKANVKGFPQTFTNRETLALTLQTLMWMSTGLHAAVNYPQYDVSAMAARRRRRRRRRRNGSRKQNVGICCLHPSCDHLSVSLHLTQFTLNVSSNVTTTTTTAAKYLAFVPNKPLGARAGMQHFQTAVASPSNGGGVDGQDWVIREVSPFFSVAREVIYIVRILTLPTEAAIDNIIGHFESTAFGLKSYNLFLRRLDEIGDQIEARNKESRQQGGAVYSYLHPSNVPSSINI